MNEARPGTPASNVGHPPAPQPQLRPNPTAGISLRPRPVSAAPPSPTIPPPPIMPTHRPAELDTPLELVDDEPAKPTASASEPPKSKIHGITSVAALAQHTYTRAVHSNQTGAVRMRTFHCRLSEQGVEYLDQIINDWLEAHSEIEVKFVNSTIGMWDGKLKEPTLILNVWY